MKGICVLRRTACIFMGCLVASGIAAQQIEFPKGAAEDEATLAAAMPAIAERLIAGGNHDLENLFRLQLVAGQYAEAEKSLAALPESAANVRWEIYAKARTLESEGKPFNAAFQQAFRDTMRTIGDEAAYRVLW